MYGIHFNNPDKHQVACNLILHTAHHCRKMAKFYESFIKDGSNENKDSADVNSDWPNDTESHWMSY